MNPEPKQMECSENHINNVELQKKHLFLLR